ncbi:hypothetical protein G5V57_24275 [Nordella sp. HKS 07]|uniref:alginate O-acetyltransferase AlgX-related protein n=1 Tax=Nordella sp. HKS 07 TaxID=2712222 RepID=UPI0013E1BABE|nr:hypothetical protein [Nordella sp. HKS 07]QIG50571.1 hypothetical protein G5V57_24275 [Nordella sp. HKS 07]
MGGELRLLYIPQAARYGGMISHEFVYDSLRNRVLKAAAEAGVEVIDLAEMFKKREDVQSLYASDWHFSEEGARVAAQAIINSSKNTSLSGSLRLLHIQWAWTAYSLPLASGG